MIYDNRPCDLGEGAFWHPTRGQFFWFDILNRKLQTQENGPREYLFSEMASAAGWLDHDTLLVATERRFLQLDLITGAQTDVMPLEADNPVTRSNDGRADPKGGFWIGTMGKSAQFQAGSIYRLYHGEIRKVFDKITISNSICFAPDGTFAHFSDTALGQVFKVALDSQGWPVGQPQVFLDLTKDGLNPDGAVLDASGLFWVAQWGAGRVAAYAPDGSFVRAVDVGGPHASCPAFGGADLTTLFCTTALQDMDDTARAAHPDAGKVFSLPQIAKGQAEHQVIL
jgi:sugar lactone lactonase YvrE